MDGSADASRHDRAANRQKRFSLQRNFIISRHSLRTLNQAI
jgi:hypothetical protein